jgi:hypothetical protein
MNHKNHKNKAEGENSNRNKDQIPITYKKMDKNAKNWLREGFKEMEYDAESSYLSEPRP